MSQVPGAARERLIELDTRLVKAAPQIWTLPHFFVSPRTPQGLLTQGIALTLVRPTNGGAVGQGGGSGGGRFVLSTCASDDIEIDRSLLPAVAPTGGGESTFGTPSDVGAILGLTAGAGAAVGVPPCQLLGGAIGGVVADFAGITNGGFDLIVGGVTYQIYGLNLASASTMAEIATLIQNRAGDLDLELSCVWQPFGAGSSGGAGDGGGFAVTLWRAIPTTCGWAVLAPFTTAAVYGEQYTLEDLSGSWGIYFQIGEVLTEGRLLIGIAELD